MKMLVRNYRSEKECRACSVAFTPSVNGPQTYCDACRTIAVEAARVYEHRYVMEQKLGRKLRAKENVHHIDGNKLNNAPSNLELWKSAQPSGQRVTDLVAAALRLLQQHPETLEEQGYVLRTTGAIALSAENSFDLSAHLSGALACN